MIAISRFNNSSFLNLYIFDSPTINKNDMAELDEKTHEAIQDLCATGDDFAEQGDFSSALDNYWNAFDLVPNQKLIGIHQHGS